MSLVFANLLLLHRVSRRDLSAPRYLLGRGERTAPQHLGERGEGEFIRPWRLYTATGAVNNRISKERDEQYSKLAVTARGAAASL